MTSSIRDRIKEVSTRNSVILAPLDTDDKPIATALDVTMGNIPSVSKKAALKKTTGPKVIKTKTVKKVSPPSTEDILAAADHKPGVSSNEETSAFLEQPVSETDMLAFNGIGLPGPAPEPTKPTLKNQKPLATVVPRSIGKAAITYRMQGSINPDYLAELRKSSTQKYIVYCAIIKLSQELTVFTTARVLSLVESWLTNIHIPQELKLRSVQPVARVIAWYMNTAKKEHVIVTSSKSFVGGDDDANIGEG